MFVQHTVHARTKHTNSQIKNSMNSFGVLKKSFDGFLSMWGFVLFSITGACMFTLKGHFLPRPHEKKSPPQMQTAHTGTESSWL